MFLQKTKIAFETGGLYLVGTPIGNMQDMTFRAIETLQNATIIFAEDTRVTKKLCDFYRIETKLKKANEHNQKEAFEQIKEAILSGEMVALVTDAGMPCISDPGSYIVMQCIEQSLPVSVIPGVSAAPTIMSVSGISEKNGFYFYGFLPSVQSTKRATLENFVDAEFPVVFYESPFRIVKTLTAIMEIFHPKTKLAIGRELTKLHETLLWTTVADLQHVVIEELETWKGEIAFVVLPYHEKKILSEEMQLAWMKQLIEEGKKAKEAAKIIASENQGRANDIYRLWLKQNQN